MTTNPKRDWTVIVMRPGHTSQHYIVGPFKRGFVSLSLVLVPIATLLIGYRLGAAGTLPWMAPVQPAGAAATDHIAASQNGEPLALDRVTDMAPADASDGNGTGAAADTRALADGVPDSDREDPETGLGGEANGDSDSDSAREEQEEQRDLASAQAADAQDADELGPALAIQMDAGGGPVMELHPFTASGKARRDTFTQLRNIMACQDGRAVTPSARLIQVLVEAHQHFNRPIVILGGHCSGHDDELEATLQHAQGRAADIRFRGVSSGRLTEWLDAREDVTGLGRYKRKGFVHMDVRPGQRATWEPDESPKRPSTRKPEKDEDEKPSDDTVGREQPTPAEATAPAAPEATAPPPQPSLPAATASNMELGDSP